MAFRPEASYAELNRVETFIEQAKTVEDLRQIAASEGAAVGYRAMGRLIAGRLTAAQMKPQEARLAEQQPQREPLQEAQEPDRELLTLDGFFPPGRQLYDYQVDGVSFLAGSTGALLGDEMGLGKSIQAIAALKLLHRRGRVKRALILCPRPLVAQWEEELHRWAPELFTQKVRGDRQRRRRYWSSGAAVLIATYETWREDQQTLPKSDRRFDLVIADEVQRIKHADAALTRAARRLLAPVRWGLSGTPLENRLEDVTTIFDFLRPDLFRSPELRESSHAVKALIAPHFLRRRVADVRPELPPISRKPEWLYLTRAQRQSYEQIDALARQELKQSGTTRVHVLAKINYLKQICSYDTRTNSSIKLDYLAGQLETIAANNQKALVFSQFPNKILAPVSCHLQAYDAAIFHGGLTDRESDRLLYDFEHKETPRVLLTSVKSGGTGLNLTRANHVFHLDHWWNPATARQADARAHRIGQERPVFVRSLFAKDTIEERIYDKLMEKQALFDSVIDDLTEEDIKGLFTAEDLFGFFDLEPPKRGDGSGRTRRTGYRPAASYAALKNAQRLINNAQSVEEVRRIADEQCSVIGFKAFCYLLGELSTPELMKNI